MAAQQGLHARSFKLAATAYHEAVGGGMSADSVMRITVGWGEQVVAQRSAEAEQANQVAQRGERPTDQRIEPVAPISGQANISTDGTMVLVRQEGWKEVKITAISAVTVEARPAGTESRRRQDPLVQLHAHSYQAGLWDADTMGQQQYAEGLRRGVEAAVPLTSANDGAPWIERITQTNFPRAIQIVDWSHASGRMWKVGNEKFGEGSVASRQWVEGRLDELWEGHVDSAVEALKGLDLDQEKYSAEVRQAPGYFEGNRERMRYAEFRAAGYPIGSGTVESGGRSVVQHRMRRPGRGWTRDHGQAILAALSELHSERFDQAWRMVYSPPN